MKLENLSNKQVYKSLLIYSLIFVAIRLFASVYGMTLDEAEHFIDIQSFSWGYLDQPPLYSWILKTFSLVFGFNVPVMVIVYHLIVFIFFVLLFKISILVFQERKKSFFCFLSYFLFFIYSYDFYRYTIHSAVMMMFCALSLYIYLKIAFGKNSLFNYLLLGLCFACGFLSKYNFIFFVLALLVASFFNTTHRKLLFSFKSFYALLIMFLCLSPHIAWLFNNDLAPFLYALKRGDAGSQQGFSIFAVLLNTYWNFIVYFLCSLLFFDFNFKKQKTYFDFFKITLLIFAIAFPLLLIIALQAGNFSQRWLAPLNIFLPLSIFAFIEIKKTTFRHKLFISLISILIVLFYSMRIASYYFPDNFKPSFLSKPYQAIYKNIYRDFADHNINIQDKDLLIYCYQDVFLLAGLKSFYKNLNTQVLNPHKQQKLKTASIVVVAKDQRKSFEKYLFQNELEANLLFTKVAAFLHSKQKQLYKIYVYELKIANVE